MQATRNLRWLAAVVVAHFVVCLVHGVAHAEARVPMSLAAELFVGGVIVAGPLGGLALLPRARRAGCWLIFGTMTAALVFGLMNHFAIAGPDHISHVDPRWRLLFAITAVLLAATEAAGAGLALRNAANG